MNNEQRTATFGAGCFWHVQAAFDKLDGVTETWVGFMGGTVENPSYEKVSSGKTGHIVVCQVTFDPSRISYKKLLDAFWEMHDATEVDRQGPDIGHQYRSVIFFHSPEQQEEATASKTSEESSGKNTKPLATQIEPASDFYRAEEYHQKYFEKTGKKVC